MRPQEEGEQGIANKQMIMQWGPSKMKDDNKTNL